MMDCPMCEGNGELDCHECESLRMMELVSADDSRCERCNGTKIVACHRCSGSGFLEQYV